MYMYMYSFIDIHDIVVLTIHLHTLVTEVFLLINVISDSVYSTAQALSHQHFFHTA